MGFHHRISLLAVSGILLAGAGIPPALAESGEAGQQATSITASPQRFGIAIESLRRTAAGHMLDLRYRVVDGGKAQEAIGGTKPYLIDEDTGRRLETPSFPKVGALRQTNQKSKEGRVYFVLFANPGGRITQGASVSLAFGEQRIEHIPVR